MKIVVDIKGELHENDMLIFKNGSFVPMQKDELLAKLNKEIFDLKNEMTNLKLGVNEKLKDYHNILQTLTKEY